MRIPAVILLFCVLGLFSEELQAQIRILPREKLESVDSPRLSGDSSSLGFNTRHIVADSMKEDDSPALFRFELTNKGSDNLDIHRLQTTCSCVSASVGQKTLKPGETTSVTVRYDPRGHFGRFEHKVFVYTQPGNSPAATLRLTVEVESGAGISGLYQVGMGNIALRSKDVTFHKGQKAVEVLKFVNLSERKLKIECEDMFLPECIGFETKPAVLGVGEEGELWISYDPSAGGSVSRIPLILKGLGVPPSQSTINITIE